MDTIITNAQSQGRVAGLASAVSNGQPVPQRLEIDDFVKNHPEAFNLYVLALESIQKDNSQWPDLLIHIGIHGLPNRPWDNVSSKTMFRREIGYCTHGSKLFPTWHRPYVSMMEQTIFNSMGKIAEQFADPKYKDAARTFRLPYWDYFQPRMRENGRIDFGLPRVLKEENLMVFRPGAKGSPVSMPNPLKSFTFPGTGGLTEEDWSAKNKGEDVFFDDPSIYSRKHTERYALSKNREKDLDAALENNMSDQLTYMNLILSDVYKDYTHFATGRKTSELNGSLENFHGNYHGIIGGSAGHMSEVEVAAFDPVFWLHHSNIDRIFAIWQAMNDDFITKTDDPKQSDDTSLYPFRLPMKEGEKEFWDSKSSKSPATFGYTYPDLENKADGKSIRRRYEVKYAWSAQAENGDDPSQINFSGDMQPILVDDAPAFRKTTSDSDSRSQPVKRVGARMMEQQVTSNPGSNHGPGQALSFRRGDEILRNEPEGTTLVVQWYVDCEVEQ
ncbi:Tyrosinase [Diplodia seriata]|uniref:tyrosinase n=1 Tax=Diplodia seriata TaxID=420778 RepID=A0A1S8BJ90_9PEZI|nr:Tyrosinase [Diplodia seriata]